VVICLERGANLHMAQLMPLPLTVSCSSKIQIGFTFLVPAYPGSPGQRAVKRVCVCVYTHVLSSDASSIDTLCCNLCLQHKQSMWCSYCCKPTNNSSLWIYCRSCVRHKLCQALQHLAWLII